MMVVIISLSPRQVLSRPGSKPQSPPMTVPASIASIVTHQPSEPMSSDTVMAAIAPLRNCPSPPRLNTPQRYAKQVHSPVKSSGIARTTVFPKLVAEPNAPLTR